MYESPKEIKELLKRYWQSKNKDEHDKILNKMKSVNIKWEYTGDYLFNPSSTHTLTLEAFI